MSRGPGNLQRDITEHLRTIGGTSTLESIRWAIHGGAKSGDLPKAWSYSVGRAMERLASVSQGHRLTIEKRPLVTPEEWLAHYPGKSHNAAVYQLRSDLLPILANWVGSGVGPLYSSEDNEEHHAERQTRRWLRRGKGAPRPFAGEWKAIEESIRPHLAQSGSDQLFYLVARGKMLFTDEPVEAKGSFRDLLARCDAQQLIPVELVARLRALADQFYPIQTAKRLGLKSLLYPCVTSVFHGHGQLKPGAVEALYKARPDYLTDIPGFHVPEPRKPGLYVSDPFGDDDSWDNCVDKGSLLTKLIDQTVYQKFHFIRLTE